MYYDVLLQTAHNRVAMEQLMYHSVCSEADVTEALKHPLLDDSQLPNNFETYVNFTPCVEGKSVGCAD